MVGSHILDCSILNDIETIGLLGHLVSYSTDQISALVTRSLEQVRTMCSCRVFARGQWTHGWHVFRFA